MHDLNAISRTIYQARPVRLQDTSQSTRPPRQARPLGDRLSTKCNWIVALSLHEERPELFLVASDQHSCNVDLVEERDMPSPDATLLVLKHDIRFSELRCVIKTIPREQHLAEGEREHTVAVFGCEDVCELCATWWSSVCSSESCAT